MPEFKICLLNDFGHVTAQSNIVHDDVEAVMAHASATAYTRRVPVEVWDGGVCVGLVAPGRARERDMASQCAAS